MEYTVGSLIAWAKDLWMEPGFKEFFIIFTTTIACFVLGGIALTKIANDPRNQKKPEPKIVAAKYLGEVVVGTKRGGFKGAMVGGILYGDAGAVIGGMAPKGVETRSRFAVQYDTGEVKIIDCAKGSELYKKYMGYVRWEDL